VAAAAAKAKSAPSKAAKKKLRSSADQNGAKNQDEHAPLSTKVTRTAALASPHPSIPSAFQDCVLPT
jgi:hypothetical protein